MYLLLAIAGVVLFTVLFCLGVMKLYLLNVQMRRRRLTAEVTNLQIECQQFIGLLLRHQVLSIRRLTRELIWSCPTLTVNQIIIIAEWAFVHGYCTRVETQKDAIYHISAAGAEWLNQQPGVAGQSA